MAEGAIRTDQGHGRMVGLILASAVSQAICAAVELGLPDALAAGPQSLDQLAARCGAHSGNLGRLMRALASFGVFARTAQDQFELTPLGETLVAPESDGRSLAGMAVFAGSHWLAGARAALTEAVRTGESGFRCAHGSDLYECMQDHPDLAALWERWAGYSAGVDALAEPILASYDFSTARHIVDVGGRYGALLARIVSATPGVTGTVFDLPDAAESARAHLRSSGVENRVRFEAGSFFDAVPDGGDLYILSNVLADWDDERALHLLRHCRAALATGGSLLVIETALAPEVLETGGVAVFDLWMMVHSGGMRTEQQLCTLVERAGFHVRTLIPTPSSAATLLEAVPV